MAELKEARVPDIGGHGDVPVIELLVKPGDTVARDQGLVTLESDKATMEVPSPFAGVVRELKVKLGDTLSEGGLVAIIEFAAEATGAAVAAAPTPAPPPPPGAQPEAVRPQAAPAEAAAPVAPVAVAATPGPIAGASAASPVAPMGAGLPPVRFDADAVLP